MKKALSIAIALIVAVTTIRAISKYIEIEIERANSVNKKIEINGKEINQLLGKSLLNDSRAIL